jgi:hypothetical protein
MEEAPCLTTQFIVLGRKKGHNVLIVSSIAHVIVNQDMGVYPMEYPGKTHRITAIAFGKVPVEIQVLGISPESIGYWALLVGPGVFVPVQGPSDIIKGNHGQSYVVRNMRLVLKEVPDQHHRGINTVRFPGMYPIINQNHYLAFLMPDLRVQGAMVGI